MRFLKVFTRLGVLLGLSLIVVAVAAGRLVPDVDRRPPRALREARSQYTELNSASVDDSRKGSRFIDSNTGKVISVNLPDEDSLFFATTSPWEDETGEMQMVGRWLSWRSSGRDEGVQQFGLARYTFPGGRVLDQVPLEVVPAGNACWFPGTSPRILYSGTDGQLYQVSFDDTRDGGDRRPPQLHRLSWKCPEPGFGSTRISDPTWPTDPRLKGRIVATLTYAAQRGPGEPMVPSQIWWLQLSPDGTAIVDLGRLTVPRNRPGPAPIERLASVAATPDHGLVLAYLSRPAGQIQWQMRVAPILLDAVTSEPFVPLKKSVRLAENVALNAPVFSSDGRWLHGIPLPVRSLAQAARYSVAAALASREARQLSWRADPSRAGTRRPTSFGLPRAIRPERSPSKS